MLDTSSHARESNDSDTIWRNMWRGVEAPITVIFVAW